MGRPNWPVSGDPVKQKKVWKRPSSSRVSRRRRRCPACATEAAAPGERGEGRGGRFLCFSSSFLPMKTALSVSSSFPAVQRERETERVGLRGISNGRREGRRRGGERAPKAVTTSSSLSLRYF